MLDVLRLHAGTPLDPCTSKVCDADRCPDPTPIHTAPYFATANGVGLSIFRFDSATGRAEPICEERSIDNPTFLSADSRTGCLYANSEVFGWHEGLVSAYRYDRDAARLVYLNKQPSLGSVTAHSSLDAEGRYLFVANYGIGPEGEGPDRAVAVYPLRPDGGLASSIASLVQRGRGHRADRQERSHPHCVLPSPDGRFLIVADLGLDALFTYRRRPDGTVMPEPTTVMALPPGSGPRHFAFDARGRFAAVIRELDSNVSSLSFNAATGEFATISTLSTLPEGIAAENHCSDVQIHPRNIVYGANRGHDSIVMMTLDPVSGCLTLIGHQPSAGRSPRNVSLDPAGRHLLVANQDSDTIAVFALDDDGRIRDLVHQLRIGSPMCVKFLMVE